MRSSSTSATILPLGLNALVIKHVDNIKNYQPDPTKGIEIYSGGHYRYLTNQSRFGSLSTLASTIHSSIAPALLDSEQSPAAVQSWVEGNSKHAHVVGPLSRYQTPSTLSTKLMPFIDNERRFTSLKTLETTVCGSILASVLDGDKSQLAVKDWLGSNRKHAHVVGPLSSYQTLSELCIELMPFVDNERSFTSFSTLATTICGSLQASVLDSESELKKTAVKDWIEGNSKHAHVVGPLSRYQTPSALSIKLMPFIDNDISRLSGEKNVPVQGVHTIIGKRASKRQEMASRPTGYRAWSRDEHMKFRELTKLLGPNIEWISFFMEETTPKTSRMLPAKRASVTSFLSESANKFNVTPTEPCTTTDATTVPNAATTNASTDPNAATNANATSLPLWCGWSHPLSKQGEKYVKAPQVLATMKDSSSKPALT
ncbi:hypothetical protein THAOC_14677 [Thalassiosira oceanica]|uniref:Uncharacterized protein n=1 Tax=Thalassiosira oceanica TaxID=159749 RepID=K0T2A1_THAOC|nr:hypothetical protein THAOC_14677 [Thalassiosira oceanica]|eukprot:EJK64577.1 hypothetical protein THAOC_14677 [Thalassiosira oceanica]